MPIRILDAATAARIAAGEVVERPSSVAKELIENALDAGATSVTVEIKDGGETYLRVTDNGCGIPAGEVRLAFENHATSKLASPDDLDDIRTLGFRGEALPSIAAVSKLECTTRVRGAQSGVKLTAEGGRILSVTEAGCPEGTTVTLRDLFFNTPVRKAFLKKPTYEAGVLSDMATKLMLGNPGVAIRLISNGKTVCHSFGDGNIAHAALAVYGKDVASQMTPIDEAEGGLKIEGLIGVGEIARPNRFAQSFFINGRLVRCSLLTQALEQAARGLCTIGAYPICALTLTLPPHAVDVNVHPNKLEVRFRDEVAVRASVNALFERYFAPKKMLDAQSIERVSAVPVTAQAKLTIVPVENLSDKAPIEERTTRPVETAKEKQPETTGEKRPETVAQTRLEPVRVTLPGNSELSLRESGIPAPSAQKAKGIQTVVSNKETEVCNEQTEVSYRIVGVALNTYLLVEVGTTLMMIDQHAAHERILYERYAQSLETGETVSQPLLAPLVLPATPREIAQIEENRSLLLEAGFDVEVFGQRDVRVLSVPVILGQAQIRPLFMEMLDRLDQLKYAAAEKKRAALIQSACKHAVKAGDHLTDGEIRALIETMEDTQAPATCPHGRPVYKLFSQNELERLFKRQQ